MRERTWTTSKIQAKSGCEPTGCAREPEPRARGAARGFVGLTQLEHPQRGGRADQPERGEAHARGGARQALPALLVVLVARLATAAAGILQIPILRVRRPAGPDGSDGACQRRATDDQRRQAR